MLVPLRAVSESLDASVEWNQQQKTAIVTKWSRKASLTVGKKTALVENSAYYIFSNLPREALDVSLDVTVRTINNRVYVPMRFISEQLGYNVEYKNNTVSIQPPFAGPARVNPYARIFSGDLSTSRGIARSLNGPYGLRNYEHPPLKTLGKYHDGSRDGSEAYLFPEGEALRFFEIEGNETITFYEYKDDFFVATWQAHVEQIEGNAIQQLFADKLKDRTGPTPKINKPFLYYYIYPYGQIIVRSGRIDVIIIFLPFGFLLPLIVARKFNVFSLVTISFFLSLVLELIQLFSGIGSCDVDDLILNTFGALLGFCILNILTTIIKFRNKTISN